LTTNCDLKCKYCYEKSCEDIDSDFGDFNIDYDVPSEINYDIDLLSKFIKKDPDPFLIFYGGEPMLHIERIKQIIDRVETKQFNIQTNGLHLQKLGIEYLNKISTIFVSIDGTEKLTDSYRGKGVYKKVTENINTIIKNGYKGEIIARMTLMEETDIYQNIIWLLNNPDYKFSSIHWQLDAGFWKNDFKKRNFSEWIKTNYNINIKKLVKFWINYMKTKGKVLRIYPLLAVMQSFLKNEQSKLRCGSGWINYSIQTDGNIIPCPAMNGMKDYYLGHIKDCHPLDLKKIFVNQPCTNCEIYSVCGGRCLFANITKQWNNKQYALVCDTVNNLISNLKTALPEVKKLIKNKKISHLDFEHQKYNSCEIIP
jgi:putative peptide-modifying radical SAM enzyme